MATVNSYNRLYVSIFALGAVAVVFGAFGAHFLAERLAEKQLGSFKTGVLYHFIHVLAAFMMIILAESRKNKSFAISAKLFMVGILLFSGSLYLLSTRELIGLTTYKWLGPLTPIGGVFFIAGWLSAVYFMIKKSHT